MIKVRPIPIIRPVEISINVTPRKVINIAKPSAFEYFHVSIKGAIVMSFQMETKIVAANTVRGRVSKIPVKTSRLKS